MRKFIQVVTVYFCISAASLTFVYAQNECNCCSGSYESFDFWIGKWSVTDPSGKVVGSNTITKMEDGCVIREEWKAANGTYTGTSYNFYNSEKKHWEQLWIDNQGQHLKLKGNREGNKMILASEPTKDQSGETVINRITWTANSDGTVRQLWEVLKQDGSKTTAFDGLYKRVD